MTEEEAASIRTLLVILVVNFPLVVGLIYANHRKWITLGNPQQPLIDLLIKLLEQATEDSKEKGLRIGKFADQMGELTEVVTRTLDFNEQLLNERLRFGAQWDGAERRSAKGGRKPRRNSRSDKDS